MLGLLATESVDVPAPEAPHPEVAVFLGLIALMLLAAKVFGKLAQRIGQPAVLGELLGGVILGAFVTTYKSELYHETIHLMAELGVALLLFAIGLETDLQKMMQVGLPAFVVACVGVVLPFALAYGACRLMGLDNIVSILAGAALTATSVGITARVLNDLGRSQDPESQIILGAAVIDDIIGLIILAVVMGMARGDDLDFLGVVFITVKAFGFLAVVLIVGGFVVPRLLPYTKNWDLPGTVTMLAIIFALGLAFLAHLSGSAMIIGCFAGGILLARAPQAHELQKGVAQLGHFFVPLFFVQVGLGVNLAAFNPLDSANHRTLLIGLVLIVLAVIGKFLAGFSPFWFKGNKVAIGVGMIPRGEVGLIFAATGLATKKLDDGMYGAITFMVMATTFMVPPLLKWVFPPKPLTEKPEELEGIEEMVTEA